MTRKLLLTIITGILAVGGLFMFFSLNGEKQRSKEEEMIAIATSDEAKKVYENYLKQEDPNAFTEKGFVQSYDIDLSSLKYNPMGGLMVTLNINQNKHMIVDFNLIQDEEGYDSVYYGSSPEFWKTRDEYYPKESEE